MIPLRDDNPTDSIPFVTVLLIVLNCVVFGYQVSLMNQPNLEMQEFVQTWGFIPAQLTRGISTDAYLSLVTCMFLHGSILHLASNMLFLWVFGDNIEDDLGHFNFIVFYFLAGIAGSLSQFYVFPGSTIPMIGASGAISGVIAAYLLIYPNARVLTAVILIIIIRLVYLPAWILLGFWILIQVLEGTAAFGMQSQATNVAWFAHIGGFVAGGILSVYMLMRQTGARS